MNEHENMYKIMFIGDSAVGKTSIILRYTENAFDEHFTSTIGIDFKNRNVNYMGNSLKVQIWDTAGQERFKTITSSYYRGSNGMFVVYDIGSVESFKNVDNWMANIRQQAGKDVVIILVGNKSDLPEEKRNVSYSMGQDLAKKLGVSFFETSCKTGENVAEVFSEMIRKVYNARNPNSENTPTNTNKQAPNVTKLFTGNDQPSNGSCC